MEFRISRHAREEMQRRGVSEVVVRRVLANPDRIVQGQSGREVRQSRVTWPDGKVFLVRVVIASDTTPPTVVTVYRASRIGRYET